MTSARSHYNIPGDIMFVEERQSLILEELHEKGKVRVKELSERFQVSEDLIRKDLTALEEKGQLKKAYGGAVMVKENVHRKIAAQRKHVHTAKKQRIAEKAMSMIQDGDIIFLDISTVNIELAKLLNNGTKKITIVTNMLDVMNLLVKSDMSVIFIGGELDYGRDGFIGSLAMEMVKNFRFDKAFMGVVGVDVHENAVMTYMANDGMMKKAIIKCSRNSYMMCEEEKFTQLGNYTYAELEDFTGVITNQQPAKDVCKAFAEHDLQLYYA